MTKPEPKVSYHQGKAIAFTNTGNCEVMADDFSTTLAYCLPGEKVSFKRVQYRKKVFDYFQDVLKASEERQEAICKHFGSCGGCSLQHMQEPLYMEYKTHLLTQSMLENDLDTSVIKPIKVVPVGERRRANMEAVKKGDKLFFGFHMAKSHAINDTYECPVLRPALQNSLPYLRQLANELLKPNEKMQLFLLENQKGVDVGFEIQNCKALCLEQRHQAMEIAKQANLQRLQFRHRKVYDVLYDQGKNILNFSRLQVNYSPWDFCQASQLAESWMIEAIENFIKKQKFKSNHRLFCDLFSGRGTLTGLLAKHANVHAFEGDTKAIHILQEAATMADQNITAFSRDLFANPLPPEELSCYDLIVIDPPRAGADLQCKNIAKSHVPNVVYVSCNPKTLARDLKCLVEAGYRIESCQPIDQFRFSNHLEVIVLLTKALPGQ